MALSEPDRYKVNNKARQTHLMVHNLTETDSGRYYCSAVYPIGSSMGHVDLKVSLIILSQLHHICSQGFGQSLAGVSSFLKNCKVWLFVSGYW